MKKLIVSLAALLLVFSSQVARSMIIRSCTVDETGGTQSATVIYDDFLMFAEDSVLPLGFEFSSIDGISSDDAPDVSIGLVGSVAYNGYQYSNEELARSALLAALPMRLSSVSYPQKTGSGNLADLEGLAALFTGGTWTVTVDGGIAIADGVAFYLGYEHMFTLSFGAASDGSRAVESYSFGSSEPLESIDVDVFNFIMNT